jgi:hypothetical protein
MNSDLSIQELTQRFADELAQRNRQQLDQAQAENNGETSFRPGSPRPWSG